MSATQDETGCDAFTASVSFDTGNTGTLFQWGVVADTDFAANTWMIVTEIADENSNRRVRSFVLGESESQQDYWFAIGRRFGAQKYLPTGALKTAIRFVVWAPVGGGVDPRYFGGATRF